MTKSCDEAWESIIKNLVAKGFKKYGLSTNVDGSKNQEVHIEKIPGYQIILGDHEPNEEYTLDDNGHDVEIAWWGWSCWEWKWDPRKFR